MFTWAITSAMAATTPPVMTLATSPPTWHSTTLSTLVQRMAVSVLASGVWRVAGAAGEDGVEDAVGDLVGRFFQARGIAPLAGISDPRAHRRDEQPGACDDGRQRLELPGLGRHGAPAMSGRSCLAQRGRVVPGRR